VQTDIATLWFADAGRTRIGRAEHAISVLLDAQLPDSRALSVLTVDDGRTQITARPDVAARLGLDLDLPRDRTELNRRVHAAGLRWHGADCLFYFDDDATANLAATEPADPVRALHADDARLFAEFSATNSADDLDAAYVELDHWAVFGAFADSRLVAASSAYPWSVLPVADVGVLTTPAYRGRGLAAALVRAVAGHSLRHGYPLQYRCQLDNAASIALAGSLGLRRFGWWDVIAADE
jgi:GNAT superfamily N-acetyltransferase